MGNIKKTISNGFNKLKNEVLLDPKKRKRLEIFIISAVFFLAGAVFTIINFITGEFTLGYVTLAFGVISLLCALAALFFPKSMILAEILFVFSALVMFFYFLVAGGAGDRGFSTYWIILLPFVSVMVLGLLKGSIVTICMFVAICIILWIPGIRENLLRWVPDRSFIVRFPLVYLAATAASLLFEFSRFLLNNVNKKLTAELKQSATHDPLTGLANRLGLNEFIGNLDFKDNEFGEEMTIANCVLIDVDNFKSANDLYGHIFGDLVLVKIADVLKSYEGGYPIRFGGDEFIVLFVNKTEEEMIELGEKIRKDIESITYDGYPGVSYTASVGVASHEVNGEYKVDNVIALADAQSGKAKKSGKNRVFVLDYDMVDHNSNKK